MAVRIDVRRAIVRSEGSERPDHIDQKFMRPLFAGPHIMVAVRDLPDFTRMDFHRLRDIELDALTGLAANGFDRRAVYGSERQCLRPSRAHHKSTERFDIGRASQRKKMY